MWCCLRSRLDALFPEISKKVESRQVKQKEAYDTTKPLREFNVVDMVFAEDFRGTGSRWIPGIVIKITVPLSYLVELATGKTVCHQVDNDITCWILMKLTH